LAKAGLKKAISFGMAEKAKGFVATGGGTCQGNPPESAKKYEK
jgi:hypothetical protein